MSSSSAASYAAVLRTRHSRCAFGAALLGRLSYGMVSLSLLLAVNGATGSYTAAGGVMAVFGLTSVLLSPARAGLVDRYGPRRALPPMAVTYAVLLGGLACATDGRGTPAVLLVVLAAAAGSTTPPLGPVMRTLWRVLIPDRPLLQRAYSLDGVAEELLFVTGPLLVGVLMRVAAPSTGLAVSAGLVATGSLLLAGSAAVRVWEEQGKETAAPTGPPEGTPSGGATAGLLGAGARMRQAVAVSAGVGTGLGALDLLVIAFADEQRAPHIVPWVLAALSGGSAVGGLVYGTVSWRATSSSRLTFLAIVLGLVVATTGLSPHPYVLVAGAALCGTLVAPTLTTAYLIADECAGPGVRTRSGAWVNTGFNAGSAGSTATAGLLVGHLPLPACFVLAAVPVVLSAVTALPVRASNRDSATAG
ncbi:MFS transporter [Streptomyces sp. NPDC057675]|uniref:MFS transporter n=1 Tax=Streptomyces sp. NPDC057675 TaxID=3346204 RepID=UPI0036805BE7